MPPKKDQPAGQLEQVTEALKSANNVLVTVNANPSIDQLAACIGLTLVLNKTGKHATAVFSGQTPSTIGFLKPEETLQKDTDSLRDFIISLDKSKADKLRYKVEDDVVRIYISPYRAKITEKDLEFSEGEFNVDVVVALGVHNKSDLDKAITAHGRILHDAAVVSVDTSSSPGSRIGTINWIASDASSLCEMVADLSLELDETVLDKQIATALLTGVVSETDRFNNEKSSPHTMSISGKLMESGASTQLITTKLEEKIAEKADSPQDKEASSGTLEIKHDTPASDIPPPPKEIKLEEVPEEIPEPSPPPEPQSMIGDIRPTNNGEENTQHRPAIVTEPPALGGSLTANTVPEYQNYSPSMDPLSGNNDNFYTVPPPPPPPPASPSTPPPVADLPPTPPPPVPQDQPPKYLKENMDDRTLTDIEKSVDSPHIYADSDERPSGDPPPPPSATDLPPTPPPPGPPPMMPPTP